jgi:hypothetical protein
MKSIAMAGIVLGMRFVESFGLVCGDLKPNNVLFDESHRIQIVGIVPSRAESHCRENMIESTRKANGTPSEFAAPEVLSGDELTRKAISCMEKRASETAAPRGHSLSVMPFQCSFRISVLR